MDLGTAAAESQDLPALIPGTLPLLANVVLADDWSMFRPRNLHPRAEALRDRNHQPSIMCMGLQAFPFPSLRQFDAQAAILDRCIHVAAAVLDADSAILRLHRQVAGAVLERNPAILCMGFGLAAEAIKRYAAVVRLQFQLGPLGRLDQQQRSQRKLMV